METTINGKKYEVNRLTGLVMRIDSGFPVSVSETESSEIMKLFLARVKANRARKARDQAYRDCGMVKVRGALGGTYWE